MISFEGLVEDLKSCAGGEDGEADVDVAGDEGRRLAGRCTGVVGNCCREFCGSSEGGSTGATETPAAPSGVDEAFGSFGAAVAVFGASEIFDDAGMVISRVAVDRMLTELVTVLKIVVVMGGVSAHSGVACLARVLRGFHCGWRGRVPGELVPGRGEEGIRGNLLDGAWSSGGARGCGTDRRWELRKRRKSNREGGRDMMYLSKACWRFNRDLLLVDWGWARTWMALYGLLDTW